MTEEITQGASVPVPVTTTPIIEEYTFHLTINEAKGIVVALQRMALDEAKITQALIDKMDAQFSAQFKDKVERAKAEAAANAPVEAANTNEQTTA